MLAREGSGGHGAGIKHDQLARRGEHRIDDHQQEDRVEPVVADRGGDRLRDLTQDRGDEHRRSLVLRGYGADAPQPRFERVLTGQSVLLALSIAPSLELAPSWATAVPIATTNAKPTSSASTAERLECVSLPDLRSSR